MTETSPANTIWQNIVLTPELSEFATLAQKTGFNKVLDSEDSYTVWAPLNGTFNFDELMQKDSIFVRQTFLENLTTKFRHALTGNVNDRITMLNDKLYQFESQNRTLGGVQIVGSDMPACNGLLYTLNGNSEFRYNLYEAFNEFPECSNFVKYFKKYDESILNVEKSVIGPMVDGKQTYLDSVMIYRNSYITGTMNANLTSEDSTYTIIMPNDTAWEKAYQKSAANHNYLATLNYQDLSRSTSSSVTASTAAVKVSVTQTDTYLAYMKDSVATRDFADYLFFNNNNHYNKFLVDEASEEKDTLYTTRRDKLSNPEEILACQVGEPIKQSNGYIRVVNDLPLNVWETSVPQQRISPFNYQARALACSPVRFSIFDEQYFSTLRSGTLNYYKYEASSVISSPEVDIYLPNIKSHKYNIYMVTVPALYDEPDMSKWNKPLNISVTLNYCDAKGNLVDKVLNSDLYPSTERIDTIQLAEAFEFPVAYYDVAMPNIKIKNLQNFLKAATQQTYEQAIRIAYIILRPVEYDEVEPLLKKED